MKLYLTLVFTLLLGNGSEDPRNRRQKVFYGILGLISLVLILLPCMAAVGMLSYGFSIGLLNRSAGLLFELQFLTLFLVVFSFGVIMNVFYFSDDLPILLPLPISPGMLILSKFTVVYIAETAMEILVIISALAGHILGLTSGLGQDGASAVSLWEILRISLVGGFGTFVLPLGPMLYCGIICLILMSFTGLVKRKETVTKILAVMTVLGIVLVLVMISLLGTVDFEHIVAALDTDSVLFVKVMNVIFPGNYLFGKMLEGSSVLAPILFLVYHAGLLLIFFNLAQILYLRGVMGVLGGGNSEKKTQGVLILAASPKWLSYVKKEWRVLYRTPAFFQNTLAINLFWPALLYVAYVVQKGSGAMQGYLRLYQAGNDFMEWAAVVIVIGASALITASNSIAGSSISREGKNYYVMKYVPVSLAWQLHVKAIFSVVISSFFCVLYLLSACVILQIPFLATCLYLAVSILTVIMICYFGIWLDTLNPKLNWDDEAGALRANINVFFNMAFAMIFTLAVVGLFALEFFFTRLPLWVVSGHLIFFLLLADLFLIRLLDQKGTKQLLEL